MTAQRQTPFEQEYLIMDQIWTGHLSTIYRCKQRSTQRIVAAKVLHPFYTDQPFVLERFRCEINILRRLDHPHIVKLIDSIEDDQTQTYVAVLEFIDGDSMQKRMMNNGLFSPQQAVTLTLRSLRDRILNKQSKFRSLS